MRHWQWGTLSLAVLFVALYLDNIMLAFIAGILAQKADTMLNNP